MRGREAEKTVSYFWESSSCCSEDNRENGHLEKYEGRNVQVLFNDDETQMLFEIFQW